MKTKKGFTLVEVLIALTIIGALFSFSYTNLRDFNRRQQAAAASKELVSAINYTRELALSGSKGTPPCAGNLDGYKITFTVTAGQDSYAIRGLCSGPTAEISVGKDNVLLASNLTLTLDQPKNFIIFKTLGEGTDLTTQGGTTFGVSVQRSDIGSVAKILVSPSGEITTNIYSSMATPTPTPGATATPTPTPPSGGIGCQGDCTASSECAGGLICHPDRSRCVNPSCPNDQNCVC